MHREIWHYNNKPILQIIFRREKRLKKLIKLKANHIANT